MEYIYSYLLKRTGNGIKSEESIECRENVHIRISPYKDESKGQKSAKKQPKQGFLLLLYS